MVRFRYVKLPEGDTSHLIPIKISLNRHSININVPLKSREIHICRWLILEIFTADVGPPVSSLAEVIYISSPEELTGEAREILGTAFQHVKPGDRPKPMNFSYFGEEASSYTSNFRVKNVR